MKKGTVHIFISLALLWMVICITPNECLTVERIMQQMFPRGVYLKVASIINQQMSTYENRHKYELNAGVVLRDTNRIRSFQQPHE